MKKGKKIRMFSKLKKYIICVFIAYVSINILNIDYSCVHARDYNHMEEVIDYKEIQDVIDEIDTGVNIDFEKSVDSAIKGEKIEEYVTFSDIKDILKDSFLQKKEFIIKMVAITLLTAIFTNFSSAFGEGMVVENSFIVAYMVLIITLISSYKDIYKIAYDILSGLKAFMSVIVPTYGIASYMSNGINTASAYSGLSVLAIMLVEIFFLNIMLPLVTSYVVIGVVNNISNKNSLSRIGEFIKMIIMWGLKGSIIVITSLSTVKKIISPTVDMATRKVLSGGLKMTPFIGKNVTIVTDTVTSAATLIRNSIGGISFVVIAVLCLIPIIKIAVYVILYKIVAIVIESISDKRVIKALECVEESTKMLMYIVMTSGLIFIITIAMLAI